MDRYEETGPQTDKQTLGTETKKYSRQIKVDASNDESIEGKDGMKEEGHKRQHK